MISLLPDLNKVMEPVLCPEAFDSEEFLFQVKWDGIRILAVVDNKTRLINKHMRDKTAQYPELQNLGGSLPVSSAVLDGEVVVLKDGQPSFPSIMRRDKANIQNVPYLKALLPVDYMVFDLLYLDGQDLRSKPIEHRLELLQPLITNQANLHPVEDFLAGKSLFAAVLNMGMEGIVAKKKGSRYSPGKSHQDWLKVKCRRTQTCLLGGYTLRGKLVNSLLLGVFRDGSLFYVGRAGSGLTAAQQEILSQQLPELKINDSPFANLPSGRKGYHYVRPHIGVLIEYLEWTEDLNLRNPVIKGFIAIDPAECCF